MEPFTPPTRRRVVRAATLAAAAAAVLALAACDRSEPPQTVAGSARDLSRDLGITAQVNAELARDRQLSALGIAVDTRDGQVTLSGRAPDAFARERATRLAAAIEGVRQVENRLAIEKQS